MKLSTFDLEWFGQHAQTHRYLDEWSRPGLTNGLGSLQADADPTAIKHLIIPPVSSAEETTALLTLNGSFLPSSGVLVDVRWTPWAVSRACMLDGWQIETRLTMPPGHPGALQEICVTNTREQTRELDLQLRLSGRCVNPGIEKWFWAVPSVAVTIDDLHGHGGLDPKVEHQPDGVLFANRHGDPAVNAQLLSPTPDRWTNTDAGYVRTLAKGESCTLWLAIGLGEDATIQEPTRALLANPIAHFQAAQASWQQQWDGVFTEGRLPDLDVPEEVAPLGAASILTALQLRRTHLPNKGKVRYSISNPRRVEACYYRWDWAMAARLLSQLDPEVTWEQLEVALQVDWHQYQQISNLTDTGDGWAYSYDPYNLFSVAWHLWQVDGRSPDFLQRRLRTCQGEMSVLDVFHLLAHDYEARLHPEFGLADYGGKESLLECVSSYQHLVAGLNAAAVWMLEELAAASEDAGLTEQVNDYREKANQLYSALMEQLYLPGEGCFAVLYPDGRKIAVRHALDVHTVLMCVGHRLPDDVRAEITTFFQQELQTPAWMRALSPRDSDAAVSGIRADHQFCGSYGAWPAQMGLGLLQIGQTELVREWTNGMSKIATQGPIAQAYFDEIILPTPDGVPQKVTDEMPHGTHWCIMGGGQFWQLVEALYSPASQCQAKPSS